MKIKILFTGILFMVLFFDVHAEPPVLVADYLIDTSLYEPLYAARHRFVPGPYLYYNEPMSVMHPGLIAWAYRKKNSNEVDIYSYAGKIATSVFPVFSDVEDDFFSVWLSCYFFDADPEWEAIVNYSSPEFFVLYDDDGTEKLRDSGEAGFGFDGLHTYISVRKSVNGEYGLKTWRVRTNVSNVASSPGISKSISGSRGLMRFYGFDDGQYKVNLSPVVGNSAVFQVYDLLGRCVMTKEIEDISAPVTFTIPRNITPNTPFIAKAKGSNGSELKKGVPVK